MNFGLVLEQNGDVDRKLWENGFKWLLFLSVLTHSSPDRSLTDLLLLDIYSSFNEAGLLCVWANYPMFLMVE